MSHSYSKHLSLDDRIIIQKGLENSSSKSAIASTLGKHKSTISREVKNCRFFFKPSTSQAKELASIIKPLILQGQSLYSIVKNNPDLNICEKTLYNYIEAGVFSHNGLIDLDLPRKVNRKLPKRKLKYKPRENRS